MLALQESYVEDFLALGGDELGRLAAQEYLNSSTARYHDEIIAMGYIPKLFDQASLDFLEAAASQTYGLLDKITRRYLEDAVYRKLFRFSPLLEQMVLLPSGYDTYCSIPICRIDIFLDERDGSFKFCEFNTDGTSAMNEDREVVNSLSGAPVLGEFSSKHRIFAQELFDPWVETFLEIYKKSFIVMDTPMGTPGCDSTLTPMDTPGFAPIIAIVDYLEHAVIDEQLEYRNRFEAAGVSCIVCDVSTLEYRDGVLYGTDVSSKTTQRIDAVYRRAVTYELLEELERCSAEQRDGVMAQRNSSRGPFPCTVTTVQGNRPLVLFTGAQALLAAVVDKKVCLIGSFQTQVAHSKAIFCMLHHPSTLEFLSEEERAFIKEHVPYTTWLKEDSIDIAMVKASPEKWIIKPVDGYGTMGVHAGQSFDADTWSKLIDEMICKDYIIQEYCTQFQTLNTLPVPTNTPLEPYNILTGLYCYAGRFAGIFTRAGRDALIVGFRGGLTIGSLLVDCDESKYDVRNVPLLAK